VQDDLVLKREESVSLEGPTSRLRSGDAGCLRDGAYASHLAPLVRDDLSSGVHHSRDSGAYLRRAKVKLPYKHATGETAD
jgi:hypothetical protein